MCSYNTSVEDLLTLYLGGRYRSLTESVILSIVYSIIFITGVVGNVCSCIVIIKNNYVHTATNYYLFSLAISDVLTLILGRRMLRLYYMMVSVILILIHGSSDHALS